MGTYTLLQATEAVQRRIKEDSSDLLNTDDIQQHINDIHKQVLYEDYFPFIDGTINFDSSIDTKLAENIDSSTISFDVADASGIPTSGTILCEGDFISYTGKTGNTLTGVSGVGSSHTVGKLVRRVYDIKVELGATNFYKPVYVQSEERELFYYDGRGKILNENRKYTIIDGFLILPENNKENKIIFRYKDEVVDLILDTDTFLIPDEYITLVVEYALYVSKIDLEISNFDLHRQRYEKERKKFLADYAHQTESQLRRIKTIYQKPSRVAVRGRDRFKYIIT